MAPYQPLTSLLTPKPSLLTQFQTPAPKLSLTPQNTTQTSTPAMMSKVPVATPTPAPISMGVQAKAPTQNVTPPSNTLPSSQIKTTTSTTTNPTQPVPSIVPAYAQPGYKSPGELADEAAAASRQQQNVINQGPADTSRPGLLQSLVQTGQSGSPTAQQAAQGLLNTSQTNSATNGPAFDAYTKAVQALQDYQGQVSQKNADIVGTGADLAFKTGEQGALQTLAAQKQAQLQGAVNQQQAAIGQQMTGTQIQQSGFNQAGALGNQSQSLQQGALGSALGARAPITQFGVQIDPITGQPISGGSAASIAAQGGQIAGSQASAANLQSQIQSTQSQAASADANFSILNSYAKGFASNVPIQNGIRQLYGTTVQGDNAIAGFQAQLQNVRAAYHNITGGDANAAIPDNITPSQLQQVQQSLKSTAANNVTGYQNQLSQLTSGSNASGSSSNGGTMFGSFF